MAAEASSPKAWITLLVLGLERSPLVQMLCCVADIYGNKCSGEQDEEPSNSSKRALFAVRSRYWGVLRGKRASEFLHGPAPAGAAAAATETAGEPR